MEIKGSTIVEINIDRPQQYEITKDFLLDIFNYTDDMKIDENGMLIREWEEYGGHHGWIEKREIRKATKEDKMFFNFMRIVWEKYQEKL